MSTHDGTGYFEANSDPAGDEIIEHLQKQINALEMRDMEMTLQLAPNASMLDKERISAYNEWRRGKKAEQKALRRQRDSAKQELARRIRERRRQAHEQTASRSHQSKAPEEQSAMLQAFAARVNYHFVDLARKQMQPDQFATAWDWAVAQANAKINDDQ